MLLTVIRAVLLPLLNHHIVIYTEIKVLSWITVAPQKLAQSHSVFLDDLLYSQDSHCEAAHDFTFILRL